MRGLAVSQQSFSATQKGGELTPGNRDLSSRKKFPQQVALRTVFVSAAYLCFHVLDSMPLAIFVAAISTIAAVFFSVVYPPWSGRKFNKKTFLKAMESGALHLTVLFLWGGGLKILGPLRTLIIEGAELPLLCILMTSVRGKPLSRRKLQAIGVLFLAYFLVALDASWGVSSKEINTRVVTGVKTQLTATTRNIKAIGHRLPKFRRKSGTEHEAVEAAHDAIEVPEKPVVEDAEHFVEDPIPEEIFETSLMPFFATCSVAAACLSRQAMTESSEQLRQVVGGGKKQLSLSLSAAALLSAPLVLARFFFFSPGNSAGKSGVYLSGSFLCSIMLLIIPYHTEVHASGSAATHLGAAALNTLFIVVSNAAFGYDADGGISFLLAVAFPLSTLGMWLLVDPNAKDTHDLETASFFSEAAAMVSRIRSSGRHFRAYVKETRKDHQSWQLFSFLVFQGLMVVVEALYGRFTSSLGLLTVSSDTLLCCTALGISLVGTRLAQTRQPTDRFSYGYERFEPLCAFVNCVILVFVAILVLLESVERYIEGALVEENRVLVVTAIGTSVNCLGLLFFPLQGGSLNVRCAYLHIVGNTMASGGLFVSTALRRFLDIYWADSLLSAVISVLILGSSLQAMVAAADCLVLRVPVSELHAVQKCKQQIQDISEVILLHSFHIWSLTSTKQVLSVRVVIKDESNPASVRESIYFIVNEAIRTQDVVIQVMREHMWHGRLRDTETLPQLESLTPRQLLL